MCLGSPPANRRVDDGADSYRDDDDASRRGAAEGFDEFVSIANRGLQRATPLSANAR